LKATPVNAIKDISGTIERLSEISLSIAAAVEQRGAATQEISRNIQQAAQGTTEVSSNITDVQRGASDTGSAPAQVHSAARSLSGDSNRLKLEVGKFLNSVRAAWRAATAADSLGGSRDRRQGATEVKAGTVAFLHRFG